MTRRDAVLRLKEQPYKLGHALGFTKLTELHNNWIIDMARGVGDKTLQSHRGSYKTTCVSIALAIIIIIYPTDKTLFMRKTDSDVKEIIAQVRKILESPVANYFVKSIYGVDLKLTTSNATEISTNLNIDPRGTAQLVAMGTSASITGKHFDRIFTDDIVNVNDRISKAERERTKTVYQELQNIKNRGGRIYNTGTPWHKEDAFVLMPEPDRYDCYETGLISDTELAEIKEGMTPSLFSANYELKHIASEDVIFQYPQTGADPMMVEQGECHLDSAFYGEDYTAFTICAKHDGKYYVYGKCWRKNVDDCLTEIATTISEFNAGRVHTELNADKGMVAKELRKMGIRTSTYNENTNKYVKITTYLKTAWKDIIFVAGTDPEYIQQIEDFNENAEHDDAPDSLASLLRAMWNKKDNAKQEKAGLWLI